ncbi:hypothetical protein M422DRAFT_161382 [Sphaerobolus stellatus SS14]|nr:hypothetical protein M422DRAFT_161382 [Sphaerobolus stellatus SS14]
MATTSHRFEKQSSKDTNTPTLPPEQQSSSHKSKSGTIDLPKQIVLGNKPVSLKVKKKIEYNSGQLDGFVKRTRPLPKPVCTSRSIQDRDSTFVAMLFRVASSTEAMATTKHVKNVIHANNPADHEMMAYRVMSLKSDRTGINGPDDFELKVGSDDDGEKYGGDRVLKIMNREGILDAVVVVTRWFGGTMLGPVRFTHIENCTLDVCNQFKVLEELGGFVEQLKSLDAELANLRAELANIEGQHALASSASDYSSLLEAADLAKARRLVKAREGAIRSVQSLIDKKVALQSAPAPK